MQVNIGARNVSCCLADCDCGVNHLIQAVQWKHLLPSRHAKHVRSEDMLWTEAILRLPSVEGWKWKTWLEVRNLDNRWGCANRNSCDSMATVATPSKASVEHYC